MQVTGIFLLRVVFSAKTVLSTFDKIRQCHNLPVYLICQCIGHILLILIGQKETLISCLLAMSCVFVNLTSCLTYLFPLSFSCFFLFLVSPAVFWQCLLFYLFPLLPAVFLSNELCFGQIDLLQAVFYLLPCKVTL